MYRKNIKDSPELSQMIIMLLSGVSFVRNRRKCSQNYQQKQKFHKKLPSVNTLIKNQQSRHLSTWPWL